MKTKNHHHFLFLLLFLFVIYFGCKKSNVMTSSGPNETYTSVNDFFAKNGKLPSQYFTVSGTVGGSFTGSEGTKVTFPPNAFIDGNGKIISGNVTVRLVELYNKSDMFFSGVLPVEDDNTLLHSGGEFFIGGTYNGQFVGLAPGKRFTALMPKDLKDTLANPIAFNFLRDSIDDNGLLGWDEANENNFLNDSTNDYDSLINTATNYIWSGYHFSTTFGDSGVWCNSDQEFTNTNYGSINIIPTDSPSTYGTTVFLIFKIKAMMHVYQVGDAYPDPFAPIGYAATIVAVGVKNNTLYSSFTPVTISNGLNVNFKLKPTTSNQFKSALNALN